MKYPRVKVAMNAWKGLFASPIATSGQGPVINADQKHNNDVNDP